MTDKKPRTVTLVSDARTGQPLLTMDRDAYIAIIAGLAAGCLAGIAMCIVGIVLLW